MRRVGSTPEQRGSTSSATCPDVVELDDGDFYIIGEIADDYPVPSMVSIGEGERAVIVPRRCIIDAAREILRNEDIN